MVDTRTVGRLETFDGKAETWTDWSFRARAWFSLIEVGGQPAERTEATMRAAEASADAIDHTALAAQAQDVGRRNYNVLAQV